jgi:Phage lysozyme
MKSRLRNAVVGVTALGMAVVRYVGGKEGLKLVTYPDIVGVWTGRYCETRGMHKGMPFTKDQCDSMLSDSLVDHESGMRKCLKDPNAIPDKSYLAFLLRLAPSKPISPRSRAGQGQQGRHRSGEAMEAYGMGALAVAGIGGTALGASIANSFEWVAKLPHK